MPPKQRTIKDFVILIDNTRTYIVFYPFEHMCSVERNQLSVFATCFAFYQEICNFAALREFFLLQIANVDIYSLFWELMGVSSFQIRLGMEANELLLTYYLVYLAKQ